MILQNLCCLTWKFAIELNIIVKSLTVLNTVFKGVLHLRPLLKRAEI